MIWTNEEIKLISKQTATKIIENIVQLDNPSYISPITQSAILTGIVNDKNIIPKVITNKETLNILKNTVNSTAVNRIVPDQIAKEITTIAFGKQFASTIFGADPSQIEVTFSESPKEGFINTVNLSEINQNHQKTLEDQNSTLETIKDFGTDKTKGFLLRAVAVSAIFFGSMCVITFRIKRE